MERIRRSSSGASRYSSSHLRSSDKPPLQSIQSCAAEEDSDALESDQDEKHDTASTQPNLVISPPPPDNEHSGHLSAGRMYKPRLQRSVTYGIGDNESEPEIPHASPPHHSPPQQSRGRPLTHQKASWTSRLARIKSLQRSRTIEARIHTVQRNPGYRLPSPEHTDKSSDAEPPSYHSLHTSIQNLRQIGPAEKDQLTPLLKSYDRPSLRRCSTQKKPRLDVATQASPPSIRLEKTTSVDLGVIGNRAKFVNISEPNQQTATSSDAGSTGPGMTTTGTTTGMEGQLQMNAAAMADGHVEDFSDPSKQSTSSYLKEQFFAFFQPSDNKLAMKLFGSKSALNKEKRRQQQQGNWIIHPCSSFR